MLINKSSIDNLNDKKWYCGAIFCNYIEHNHHGCKYNCPFCYYTKLQTPIYMSATNENIIEFIQNYFIQSEKTSIEISGGGDPLYNFEKNKNDIVRIINCIKSCNIKRIEIFSRDYETILKYYNNILNDVTSYCISTEVIDEELIKAICKIREQKKYVRISLWYSGKTADRMRVEKLAKIYSKYANKVVIKLDWTVCNNITDEQLDNERSWGNSIASNIRLIASKKLYFPLLVNNEFWTCYDFDHKVLKVR